MFQKNVLLAIPFSLLETCAQFPEFPMVALLNFTDLTPETISNHKKNMQYERRSSPKIARFMTNIFYYSIKKL